MDSNAAHEGEEGKMKRKVPREKMDKAHHALLLGWNAYFNRCGVF